KALGQRLAPGRCSAYPVATVSPSPLEGPTMRRLLSLLMLAGLLCLLAVTPATSDPPQTTAADVILVNGKVWTVNKAQPEVEALPVWHERILAAGSTADVKKLAGPSTRTIDLHGRRVVPGLYDSHIHLLGGGLQLSRVTLKDAPNEAEFGRRLR